MPRGQRTNFSNESLLGLGVEQRSKKDSRMKEILSVQAYNLQHIFLRVKIG